MFREFERERLGEYESVTLPRPPTGAEEETQELPPVAPEPDGRPPGTAPGPAARLAEGAGAG
ncbi:hypothetical protein ACFWH4_28180, partial [Streptomyces sp. NPDC127091]